MEFGLFELLKLVGALGFFIYGMKVMSEGIQKVAGDGLRTILSAMTKNRFRGVLTGLLVTTLVQSSSASTVMVVSFVNAGLLNLVQAIGVIMGANVGTTTTAWLVTYFGLMGKFKLIHYALPIIAIGFPMMFSKSNKLRSWSEFLIGFAILFMGLAELKDSVPDIKHNPEILAFLSSYADIGFMSLIMFVGVGTILTLIVQSSSAAMALTLVMCSEGWIPFEVAAAMVLGENIGTTITANLAALIGNVHAKRAARAHLIFNLFGVFWMLVAFKAFVPLTIWLSESVLGVGSPYLGAENVPLNLSVFHTTFNIVNTFTLVWFAGFIEKIVIRMVPSKGDADEEYSLEFISTGMMATPEMSIMEAQKEVAKFGGVVKRMNGFVKGLISEQDNKKTSETLARIKKYEDITDRIEADVADYLAKVSQGEMSESSSLKVRGMLSIIGDLERIGDIYYQMSKTIERKNEGKIWFTPEQRNNINEMFEMAQAGLETMCTNLEKVATDVTIDKANEHENALNIYRKKIRKEHLVSVEKGDYNFNSATIYADLFNSIEKVGDHTINVTEGIVGEV